MTLNRLIQTIFTRKMIDRVINTLTHLGCWYYGRKFSPLIIRDNKTDFKVFRNIFTLQEMALPFALDAKLIIDGGAYTGISSLFFASTYPEATILAVEPEHDNYAVLEQHAAPYNGRIVPINKGLWPTNAKLRITDPGTGDWGFMVEEVSEQEPFDIQGVTIPELLAMTEHNEIDILKLDIEGSERELFEKNTSSWLPKVKVIIVEFHDRKRKNSRSTVEQAMDLTKWDSRRKAEKMMYIRKDLLQ